MKIFTYSFYKVNEVNDSGDLLSSYSCFIPQIIGHFNVIWCCGSAPEPMRWFKFWSVCIGTIKPYLKLRTASGILKMTHCTTKWLWEAQTLQVVTSWEVFISLTTTGVRVAQSVWWLG